MHEIEGVETQRLSSGRQCKQVPVSKQIQIYRHVPLYTVHTVRHKPVLETFMSYISKARNELGAAK